MNPPSLSASERKHYRGLAMQIKPGLLIGKSGITPALLAEAAAAFARNPLLKIRLPALDRKRRKALIDQFAVQTGSQICGESGHTAALYRTPASPPAASAVNTMA